MRILLCILLICITTMPALAGGPIHARGVGRVNPKHTGAQARLMAERAAQVDAARQLVAQSNPQSVRKSPDGKRVVTHGTLRGHRYRSTRWLGDGSVRVVAEVPVNSGSYRSQSSVR